MSGPKRKNTRQKGPNRILIVVTIVVIALLVMAPLFTILTGVPQ